MKNRMEPLPFCGIESGVAEYAITPKDAVLLDDLRDSFDCYSRRLCEGRLLIQGSGVHDDNDDNAESHLSRRTPQLHTSVTAN